MQLASSPQLRWTFCSFLAKLEKNFDPCWVIKVMWVFQTRNFCRFNSELSSAVHFFFILMHTFACPLLWCSAPRAQKREERVWNFPCNCSFTPFFTCSILVFCWSCCCWRSEVIWCPKGIRSLSSRDKNRFRPLGPHCERSQHRVDGGQRTQLCASLGRRRKKRCPLWISFGAGLH